MGSVCLFITLSNIFHFVEPQQIKSIVSGSASTSGERKPNSQEFTSKQNFPAKKNSNETKKVVGEKADINRDAIGIYFEHSPTCSELFVCIHFCFLNNTSHLTEIQ